MEFKEIKKFDEFFEQLKQVIYPQLTEEAERVMKNRKNAKNIDGSVSKAANEILKYGIDLKNGRDLDEIIEEMYQSHKKDSVVEEDDFKFTIFAISYFIPQGTKVFRAYNKRSNIKEDSHINGLIEKMEAKAKILEAELELERVKQEVHEASKRD